MSRLREEGGRVVRTSVEGARGCGFRKPGGLYLVAPALSENCSRLPFATHSCPTCGAGIHPARGWTWIVPLHLIGFEAHAPSRHSIRCPIGMPGMDPGQQGIRAGLLWIGEQFYPTPASFLEEAARMGVSRRISKVPREWKPGTYVFLAHRKAINPGRPNLGDELHLEPGIVSVFRPTAIEYVVKGDETEEELAALEKRGIEPVKVIPDTEQTALALDAAE